MGHRPLVPLRHAQGSRAELAPARTPPQDLRLRNRDERALAHHSGLAPARLGPRDAQRPGKLALRAGRVRQSRGAALGAKNGAAEAAEIREPVILAAREGYRQWAS